MNMPEVATLEPTGNTGGRAYLRMVHESLSDSCTLQTVRDYKRGYRMRRWRKVRHLGRMIPVIRLHRMQSRRTVFVWDDISLLLFSDAMLSRTVFILHHVEPRQFDSNPIEPWLWRRLLGRLRSCRAVVCVSPFWQRFLAQHGVNARVIYNAFDMPQMNDVSGLDRDELRTDFELPRDKIVVYLGKAVHWKGVDRMFDILSTEPDIHLVTTGSRTVPVATDHRFLPYDDYLRLMRACDVGVFAPSLREGWSRCAAEAVLVGLPCLMTRSAGLGDLARLTGQPKPRLDALAHHVRVRAREGSDSTAASALAQFDRTYFDLAWRSLIYEASTL